MNYTFVDLGRLAAAVAVLFPILILPGVAVASALNLLSWREAEPSRRPAIALLAAFVLVPLIYSLVLRTGGFAATLGTAGVLAVIGARSVLAQMPWRSVDSRLAAVLAVWLLVVAAMWVDLDWRGGLYQSALVLDTVKHAATIQMLANAGLPMADPFFARDEPVSYYYLFYVPGAVALKAAAAMTDARALMGGLVFWSGPALAGFVSLVLSRSGLVAGDRRSLWLAGGFLLVTGLDIIPLMLAGSVGIWYPSMDWWNEQISGWLASLLWVPHHVTGLIACWLGFLVVAEGFARHDDPASSRLLRVAVAGAAFAAALGMSVWLTLCGAVVAGIWLLLLAREARWRDAGMLAAAGVAGLVLAAPFLAELLANRAFDGTPVGPTIRAFSVWDAVVPPSPARYIGRAALLPVNYAVEFGAFALGSIAFWCSRRGMREHPNDVARLLTIAALVSLFIATFVKSKVINNDLGWRVPLFAQLSMLVWTVAWLDGARFRPALPAPRRAARFAFSLLAGFGVVSTVYGLLALRLYLVPGFYSIVYLGADPRLDRSMREAYEWLNAHAPAQAVTQHDPTPRRRFDFGLYGHHAVGVADREANLFGASRTVVRARVGDFSGLFRSTSDPSAARRIATRHGVHYLVVSRAEPVWRDSASWVWTTPPVFENEGVRVLPVKDLAGTP